MSFTIFGLIIDITTVRRYKRKLIERQEALSKTSRIIASMGKKNLSFGVLKTNISAKDFEINIDRHKNPE